MKGILILRLGSRPSGSCYHLCPGRICFVSPSSTLGPWITVYQKDVIDGNLYATGAKIEMFGTIHGDLMALGDQIIIYGTVEGNVYAVAQSLNVIGTINGDVVAVAQDLRLSPSAMVNRNVLNIGSRLQALNGSTVNGDIRFYGSRAALSGTVGGDVQGSIDSLGVWGVIGRNVDVQVSDRESSNGEDRNNLSYLEFPKVAPGLHLYDGAIIGGYLTYETPIDGDISPGAKITGPVLRKPSASGNNRLLRDCQGVFTLGTDRTI